MVLPVGLVSHAKFLGFLLDKLTSVTIWKQKTKGSALQSWILADNDMYSPEKIKKYILSFLHGTALFIFLYLLHTSSFTTDADEALLSKVKRLEQKMATHKSIYRKDFVFINVSKDLKLQQDPADYGAITMTDRAKLAEFFQLLAAHHNKHFFVLCDVFLQYPSEDDTLLQAATENCTSYLFPSHFSGDTVQQPVLKLPTALADYTTYTGHFSKFKLLYQDSLKTLPLVLLEQLDKRSYEQSMVDFGSVFPDYYITKDQLNTKTFPYYNLGELLILSKLTPNFFDQYLKNKFIVIGNFDTDIQNTAVGQAPGSLILLNTYLTLYHGKRGGGIWAVFMLIMLTLISYLLFFSKLKAPKLSKGPWVQLFMDLFINNYFTFSGICLILLFVSSVVFSVDLNIALLLSYLCGVNFSINFYKEHFKKPE